MAARVVAFILIKANVAALRPNLPPTRELDYLGNVMRRLRRVVRKSPVGETAASLRRRMKERLERQQLLRQAGAGR